MLRHVRGVLRRRGLELTLVERRPSEPAAFAPLAPEEPSGAGLAVIAQDLSSQEVGLIEQVVTPLERQRDSAAKARAEQVVHELAALTLRLHTTLVKIGLRSRR